MPPENHPSSAPRQSATAVFLAFLRLGCTSFGGPVAHLGYFQREFVERRAWVSADAYAELVALSQSLPGPASSQVGFGIGMLTAGMPGALAAWVGFTGPSAALMLAFAFGHAALRGPHAMAALHGLQLVAVAVVAQAVLAMQKKLSPDAVRMGIAAVAAALALWRPAGVGTLAVLVVGAAAGRALLQGKVAEPAAAVSGLCLSRRVGGVALGTFAVLLLAATLAAKGNVLSARTLAAAFYRTGALVFGGGHVVLPLLQNAVVAKGWIGQDAYLAGYGAAQALPGPLFSFAAYVGAAAQPAAHPLLDGLLALVCLFLPGLLLITAALPFWGAIRSRASLRSALAGINAAMVGVLFAAMVHPVWTESVHSFVDVGVAGGVFAVLTLTRMPAWAIVLCVGGLSWAASLLPAGIRP
ncbi:chromate transporter [Bryocella elongata]|uniref:Chromate transporter n=1 Tax=Bryocella elongata TaxID=863522 RepID=A0A1H5Y2R5_9BACT|nr:chromate efflux transporter [Bryocella elongata]SEG18095.1 chromate transporter [Bryocella elongata]